MVEPLRHRQTKGAETDMPGLPPPRHFPTLPTYAVPSSHRQSPFWGHNPPSPSAEPSRRRGCGEPLLCCYGVDRRSFRR